jgi:hypothetical protein
MERLVTVFGQTRLSCYLWVATKCVQEHSDGEGTEMTMAMLSFVERLSITMFSLLNEKKPADIPDGMFVLIFRVFSIFSFVY